MPMPRSKPSRITYIATAVPISAAQITGRYHSMARLLAIGGNSSLRLTHRRTSGVMCG